MNNARASTLAQQPRPMRYLSGLRPMLWMLLVTGSVSVWMSCGVYHDSEDRMHGDLWAVVLFAVGFNAMVAIIALGIGLQRLHLDPQTRQLRYANISSLHRWRCVDAGDIVSIRWNHAMDRPKALVDSLELALSTGPDGRTPRPVYLIDAGLTPAFSKRPSPLFMAVARFVKICNPKAEVPAAFGLDQR